MKQKFLNESPPRYIDMFSQSVVILSGFLQQFGWAFFSFGMIFVWVFGMQSTAVNVLKPIGKSVETTGTLTAVSMTSASQNEDNIYRYTYTYIHAFREYEGRSYGTASDKKAGDQIPVRYSQKHPERSVIPGMRRAVFSAWVLFVVLFPLVGLGLIISQILKNVEYLRLLRFGTATKGRLVDKSRTNKTVTINDVSYPVYAFSFQFEHNGEIYKSKAETHLTERLEDDSQEIILFDALNPTYNLVFDAMPGGPRIDDAGYLKPASPFKIVLFILPLLCILINWIGYVLSSL
ncbi:MAG: DUF3592 domain-containing protein [Saprospiraceae bacterium]|nr:DUF3592 domain-containing protein [Saprospiraceae bacterium]